MNSLISWQENYGFTKMYKKLKFKKFIFIGITIISLFFLFVLIHFKYAVGRPSIILITIDALRADHLGCYGYERKTSPNIDKLAKEGVIFLNCFATSSATIWASVGSFTGNYLGTDKYDLFLGNILDEKFITLAEYLRSLGYYTEAFASNGNYRKENGFAQGFDYYCNYVRHGSEGAENITPDVLNFLNNYRRNNPFFIWIHYSDAHIPYKLPQVYFNTFYNDRLYKENDKILELKPEGLYPEEGMFYPWTSHGYIPPIAFHKEKYNLNYYIAHYDTKIRYIDFYIGKLLKNIKGDTLIILSADHGEAMGEHNVYFTHGENIHDEQLHIPLIIKDYRYFKGGRKISAVSSSTDIVPTILSRVNPIWYSFNKNKFNGVDLTRILNGKDIKRKYVYSYFPWAWSIRDVNKNIKYILSSDGKEELYFLPDEYTNHINNESLEVIHTKEELRKDLKNWLKVYPIRSDINPKKVSLDEATQNNLRSLGYLQ